MRSSSVNSRRKEDHRRLRGADGDTAGSSPRCPLGAPGKQRGRGRLQLSQRCPPGARQATRTGTLTTIAAVSPGRQASNADGDAYNYRSGVPRAPGKQRGRGRLQLSQRCPPGARQATRTGTLTTIAAVSPGRQASNADGDAYNYRSGVPRAPGKRRGRGHCGLESELLRLQPSQRCPPGARQATRTGTLTTIAAVSPGRQASGADGDTAGSSSELLRLQLSQRCPPGPRLAKRMGTLSSSIAAVSPGRPASDADTEHPCTRTQLKPAVGPGALPAHPAIPVSGSVSTNTHPCQL